MSFYVPSKARERWLTSVHKVIIEKLEGDVVALEESPEKTLKESVRLQWRLAWNTFYARDYFKADKLLENVRIVSVPNSDLKIVNRNHMVHWTAARCSVQLFHRTKSHYHLENAHTHFESAISYLKVDLGAMWILPGLLFEFGELLELYGSFDSALDNYSRIVTNFPFYPGYFETMYRSAIVGKHMAEQLAPSAHKEEVVNNSIDVFQFLLEAVPSSINELHLVLLYAKSLEMTTKTSVRYRAKGAYNALYDYCKSAGLLRANEVKDGNDWLDDPKTWLKMGQLISAQGEPIVAKDAFRGYVDRLEERTSVGRPLHKFTTIDACMAIARNFATFQDYDNAVVFGSHALKIDRYLKEVRHPLAQWSAEYAAAFKKEQNAVCAIEMIWKGRCWTTGFRKRLRNLVVQGMEMRLNSDRFDFFARAQLSYYARNHYRSKFMFEEACATRIQRFVRQQRKVWVWQASQRNSYLNKASEAYRLYQRRPMDTTVRADIISITNHRFCPKRHAIRKVRVLIDTQDHALKVIMKIYRLHLLKKRIADIVALRETRHERLRIRAAIKIQGLFRLRKAYLIYAELWEAHQDKISAAETIQQFVRWRNKQWKHIAIVVLRRYRMRRDRAAETLSLSLRYRFNKYKLWRYLQEQREALERLRDEDAFQARKQKELVDSALLMLQRFFRRVLERRLVAAASAMLAARRAYRFSQCAQQIVNGVKANTAASLYKSPGIRPNTTAFAAALQQSTVYCQGNQFLSADCMMLSNVLRHSYCGVQRLIVHDTLDSSTPTFEFDLIPAVNKCRSLRSVVLLEGKFTDRFLLELFNSVQMENPRVVELLIEGISSAHLLSDTLMTGTSRLLMDYFNYSLPGITTLSLHGCRLEDKHMSWIAQGLEVNSSIQNLYLSLNLIHDEGFMQIFQAVSTNKKSCLKTLDFACNLIKCRRVMRDALDRYVAPNLNRKEGLLMINLQHNLMYETYEPSVPYGGRPHLAVLCTNVLPPRGTYGSPPSSAKSSHNPSRRSTASGDGRRGTGSGSGGRVSRAALATHGISMHAATTGSTVNYPGSPVVSSKLMSSSSTSRLFAK